MSNIGLPVLSIEFKQKAATAISRSSRGVVLLLLNDATKTQVTNPYTSLLDVDKDDWTEDNYKYLKYAFKGKPSKVIALRGIMKEEKVDVSASKQLFGNMNYDWFAFPECTAEDAEALASFFNTAKTVSYKKWKAVLPNCKADSPAVVNFATSGISIVWDEDSEVEEVSTAQYTVRIAGLLAGVSLTQSSTYKELDEIVDIEQSEDPDKDIDDGKLILIYDGEKFKIARGVTSLTTVSDEKPQDFRIIKIVEASDLVRNDIMDTFNDTYVGNFNNTYDNKKAFVGAVMIYLQSLEGTLIDADEGYEIDLNLTAAKNYLETERSMDTSDMSDLEILKANTGSHLFVSGHMKFLDAMEDLHMEVTM